MKLHYLFIFLLLLPAAFALNIDLSINKVLTVDTKYFLYNDSLGTKMFTGELLNSGSIPYAVQARIDIFDGNNTLFTGWTQKTGLMPGSNFPFSVYWVPEKSGHYTARLRVYYGNEINETFLNITTTVKEPQDGFEINSVRTFNNYLLISVTSKTATAGAVIIPSGYEPGWIFTESALANMQKGSTYQALLAYEPAVWYPQDLNLTVVTINGDYTSSKIIHLDRETGLDALIFNLIFGLAR